MASVEFAVPASETLGAGVNFESVSVVGGVSNEVSLCDAASFPGVCGRSCEASGSLVRCMLRKISLGMSAMAIPMPPRSETRDMVQAEMGSGGWSSVLYSFGRYLLLISLALSDIDGRLTA